MDRVAVREGVIGRKPLRLCMLSRLREGRGTALELESAAVSDPEGSVSRLRCPATGLADPNASTMSMGRSGEVQRGMNPQPEGLDFPEVVQVVLFYQLIV